MHPLDWVLPEGPKGVPVQPLTLVPEIVAPKDHANGGGPSEAIAHAKKMTPKMVRRLVELALLSPNHNAARAAARDVLQIGGVMVDSQRVDVVISFRAIFQRMTAEELDHFLQQKVFPERLRDEALKLLENAA